MTKESYFLLFISIGVFPAALGYGLNPKEFLPGNFIHEVARGAIHEAVIKRLGPNFPNVNQIASQITNKICNFIKLNRRIIFQIFVLDQKIIFFHIFPR